MITNRIHEWARIQPDKMALICNAIPLSYAQLSRALAAAREFFVARNLPVGGRVIVVSNHFLDAWLMMLGLRAMGMTTMCAQNISIAAALAPRDTCCLVLPEREMANRDARLDALAAQLRVPVLAAPSRAWIEDAPGELPAPIEGGPPFGGHILFTSGTTGSSHRILKTGAVEEKRNLARAASCDITRTTIYHARNIGPWAGTGFNLPAAVWQVGGGVIMDHRPNAWAHFTEFDFTLVNMTAFQLRSWLNHLRQTHDQTGAPEAPRDIELMIGGGPVTLDVANQARALFARRITANYSSTECNRVMRSVFEQPDDLLWLTPIPGRVLEIVDGEGRLLGTGQEGRMRIRLTDIDAHEYMDDPQTSAQFFRDGCFYPGDMAMRREDGRIRILGRGDEVLNLQGRKKPAGPLEYAASRFLGVDTVCLFSALNAAGLDELMVAIEASALPAHHLLDQFAASEDFRAFDRVRFKAVPEFPRTEGGMQKLRRAALRQMVLG